MIRFLWAMRRYFRQVAGLLVLGSISGIVMNTSVVLPAIYLGRAIDAVKAWAGGQGSARAMAWAAALFTVGVALVEIPRLGKRWFLITANARIRASIRADAMRGVLAWPLERHHATPIGDLMARIVGDVEVLGVGVREFTVEMWDTVLFSVSLVVALFCYDAGLTALALAPVPFAMLIAHAAGRWVRARTTASREANAALTSALQELLSGARVLRLFGRIEPAVERVAALASRQCEANLATARLQRGLTPVYSTLMTAGVVMVVWLGGRRAATGTLSIGAFVAYLELYLRFVNRGFRVPQLVNSVQSGAAAYARIEPLLAAPRSFRGEPKLASFRPGHVAGLSAAAPPTLPPPTAANGGGPIAVSVRESSFRYPQSAGPALRGVSLEIAPGALVAITGPIGSGKSALARTILGLYPLDSGEVVWDGRPITDTSVEERAARCGYLPQDPYLFSGSVRENVLMERPASGPETGEDVLRRLTGRAALEADLAGFPEGVDTEIGELGARVSGGQRQRIALARALAAGRPAPPGLLVLDDPFSSVDVATEARMVAGLREAYGPCAPPHERATIVLFSHRLAAFPLADLVVVLDEGRVEETGTHAQLMQTGGLYSRIYGAQRRAEDGEGAKSAAGAGARVP